MSQRPRASAPAGSNAVRPAATTAAAAGVGGGRPSSSDLFPVYDEYTLFDRLYFGAHAAVFVAYLRHWSVMEPNRLESNIVMPPSLLKVVFLVLFLTNLFSFSTNIRSRPIFHLLGVLSLAINTAFTFFLLTYVSIVSVNCVSEANLFHIVGPGRRLTLLILIALLSFSATKICLLFPKSRERLLQDYTRELIAVRMLLNLQAFVFCLHYVELLDRISTACIEGVVLPFLISANVLAFLDRREHEVCLVNAGASLLATMVTLQILPRPIEHYDVFLLASVTNPFVFWIGLLVFWLVVLRYYHLLRAPLAAINNYIDMKVAERQAKSS